MIANVSAHRRANAFAQALEERATPDTAAEQSADPEDAAASAEEGGQERLFALARGLGELPRPALDPEVKVVQRAQLVAAMEAMLKEGTAGLGPAAQDPTVPEQRTAGKGVHRASPLGRLRPRSRLAKTLAAGGLTVGVAAGAFSGVAAASSNALPGDQLYGLKRGMEDIRLDLADNDSSRGSLYLDHASTRLSEARRLMERGRGGHQLDHESLSEIRRTLTGMKNDAAQGHKLLHAAYERDPDSLGPIATLSSFSAAHRQAWEGLRDQLPPQLTDVGDQVNSVFDAIDDEVAPLQSRLPQPERTHDRPAPAGTSGRGGSGAGSGSGSSHATPSAGETQGKSGRGAPQTPSDGGSSAADDGHGLIGGAGSLIDPPSHDGGLVQPSPSQHDESGTPAPDVTLPPLLPGLLPGLGIDTDDTGH